MIDFKEIYLNNQSKQIFNNIIATSVWNDSKKLWLLYLEFQTNIYICKTGDFYYIYTYFGMKSFNIPDG
jgi:hypothetical protein